MAQSQSPPAEAMVDEETQSPKQDAADLEKMDDEDLQLHSMASIAERMPLTREVVFVGIICLAQFTTQVALGQALSILKIIGQSFGLTTPSEMSWLIAGYSLTVGTFILIFGRFGDIFGHKRMFIIGFIWFAIWSAIAGLSVFSNHVLFIFARVLQGIGPAITLPNGLALLGLSYNPGPRKDMAFALFGACAPGGGIVGSLFGGIFALTWWPWTFWSFAIVLAAITAVATVVIPDPPRKLEFAEKSLREKLIALDLPGAATGTAALVLFNFAWNQAPIVGWQKAYVYVSMIIGLLFVPVFFYIELWKSPMPLIPFDALTTDVAFVLACIACGWGSFGIFLFYTWNFAFTFKDASPLLTTAYLSPVAVSGALASVCTGILLGRLRPAWVMTIALSCFTVGNILIATAPPSQTYWAQFFVCTIVTPWGMDMSFPAATLLLSNAVSKEHQGISASLVSTVVNYSISLGLGFAGTVEVHVNSGGRTPSDVLRGYRGAWYFGIGSAGFGLAISIVFLVNGYLRQRRVQQHT